ncbi:MAG: choice-of-anchor D domain-containing protein [Deltaproteobacteria bacterium]|nr:choice-of-anchor D domain-containing protein [Deltaproteobacteria bacterium]
MRRAALLLALFAVGCGGEDGGLIRVPAAGYFDPQEVDFGVREVGQAHELPVRLTNGSAGQLALVDLSFEPRLDVFVVRRADGGSVRAERLSRGQSLDLVVVFGPATDDAYSSTLVLKAEDLEVALPVRGEGRLVMPARFEGPSELAFPEPVEVGAQATLPFGITNRGERPGRLVGMARSGPFTVTAPGGAALSTLPEVGPGEHQSLELLFQPIQAGAAEGQIRLQDSEGQSLLLTATATAVEAGRLECDSGVDFGPVARGESQDRNVTCTVSGGAYRLEAVSITGDGTSDVFTVSSVNPGPGSAVQTLNITVHLDAQGRAGPRTGDLTIRARTGALTTVPLSAEVTAPDPATLALQVDLQWSLTVDLDLHLVKAGGAPFTSTLDCYWEVPAQDWGVVGAVNDDAYLDQDARRGPAHELINLGGAAQGVYEVWVHYFGPATGGARPATDFTVAWRIRDTVVGSMSHTLGTCGQMWLAGRAHVDAGDLVFEPVDQTSDAYRGYTFECGP